VKGVWYGVKHDRNDLTTDSANAIEKRAVLLAAEAIQVAAMARKMQGIEKGGDS
jgi:hypothetical protein